MFHVVIVSSKTYLHKYIAQLVLLALTIVRVDCLHVYVLVNSVCYKRNNCRTLTMISTSYVIYGLN